MPDDKDWPDDMPPVEESLGIDSGEGVSDEVEEELAEKVLDEDVEDEEEEVDGDVLRLMIDGETELFISSGGCERCGSNAAGVLHRDSWDRREVTGGAYMLCGSCKEDVMPNHEEEGFEWTVFNNDT